MKRNDLILFASAAIAMLTATPAVAQQQEDITLPVSLYNQTVWPAVETTIALDSEGEEMPAYELQGWQTYQGMSRRGKVFYVPSAVDDRIILVMQDADSGFNRLPMIIDNKTNKQLIIHVRGKVTLYCLGTAIRSEGPVSIFGEDTEEDGAEPVTRLALLGDRRGHAAIETKGDIYMQDVILDMVSNKAPYAFLCSYSGDKEEHALELNHVLGKVEATKQTVMGFQSVIGSQGTSVQGIDLTANVTDEEDPAPEATEASSDLSDPSSSQPVYDEVDEKPAFPGGPDAMRQWMNENMKYPVIAQENGIQGRVYIQAIVEPDGSFSDISVLRGTDTSLNNEALRLIKAMPKWTPGRKDGQAVRSKYVFAVPFILR